MDPNDVAMQQAAMNQAKADMASRTAGALGDHAKSTAIGMVQRRIRDTLKPYLPRFLHPLLPGTSGTVAGRAKHAIKRSISRWIAGCVFTAVFFTVFFGLVVGVLGFAGVMIWMSI